MLASDRWRPILRSIYGVSGSPEGSRQRMMALSLWCSDKGAISHESAAQLWELRIEDSGKVEVTVTTKRPCPTHGVTLHFCSLPPSDVATFDAIRVTTAARTLVDLAGSTDPEALEIALDDALRRRLVRIDRLLRQLDRLPRRGRAGTGRMRRLLAERNSKIVPHSPLETLIGRVFRASDLELPVSQFRVLVGRLFVARLDYAWPELKVGVECESFDFHSGRLEWRRDAARLNELASLGWIVLRATQQDVANPGPLLDKLRRLVPTRRTVS